MKKLATLVIIMAMLMIYNNLLNADEDYFAHGISNGPATIHASCKSMFAGGHGTEEEPWLIATAEHLYNVRNYSGQHHADIYFLLISDIDLYDATREGGIFENPTESMGEYDAQATYSHGDVVNDSSGNNYVSLQSWNTGNSLYDDQFWYLCNNYGWEPIGRYWDDSFSGHFDGAGHSITGIFINRPAADHVGLFGTFHGTVKDLNIENVDITGQFCVGGLIGVSMGTVDHCSASGIIKGTYVGWRNDVGGLVGMSMAYIGNSSFTGFVSGIRNVGGLAGSNVSMDTPAIIEHSFADAEVFGSYYAIGGLVGYNAWGSIVRTSYTKGNVIGAYSVGGLVGANHWDCLVENSYSMASVTGEGEWGSAGVGGLVGANDASQIVNSYSTGSVEGEEGVGGLVGIDQYPFIEEDIINSYWNIETSGQTESFGGEGRTTAEMTYPYDADTYVGWDFSGVWAEDINADINSGYPFFGITSYFVPAIISLENPSVAGIWKWTYNPGKSLYLDMGRAMPKNINTEKSQWTWQRLIQGLKAQKLMAADISGDGLLEVIIHFECDILGYYSFTTGTWSVIMNDCFDFVVARTDPDIPKKVVFSIAQGVYVLNYGENLTRIYSVPAEIIHAADLYRDGLDELLIGFSALPNLYVYSFASASHSVLARIKPSQMVTGDLTGDGHNELVCAFQGFGIYLFRNTSEKEQLNHKLDSDALIFDIINDVPKNHRWVSGNRGWQIQRITYADPMPGHRMATGNIAEGDADELVLSMIGRTYYYSYITKGWTTLTFAPMKTIIAGRFTGGEKDDLITCMSMNNNIFLRPSALGAWQLMVTAGNTNAMTPFE